jgi:hypothetical protein
MAQAAATPSEPTVKINGISTITKNSYLLPSLSTDGTGTWRPVTQDTEDNKDKLHVDANRGSYYIKGIELGAAFAQRYGFPYSNSLDNFSRLRDLIAEQTTRPLDLAGAGAGATVDTTVTATITSSASTTAAAPDAVVTTTSSSAKAIPPRTAFGPYHLPQEVYSFASKILLAPWGISSSNKVQGNTMAEFLPQDDSGKPIIRVTLQISGISIVDPSNSLPLFAPIAAELSYNLEYNKEKNAYDLSPAGFTVTGKDVSLITTILGSGEGAKEMVTRRAQNKSLLAFPSENDSGVNSLIQALEDSAKEAGTLLFPRGGAASPSSDPASEKNNFLRKISQLQAELQQLINDAKYDTIGKDLTNAPQKEKYDTAARACEARIIAEINKFIKGINAASISSTEAVALTLQLDLQIRLLFATGTAKEISDSLIAIMQEHPDRAAALFDGYLKVYNSEMSRLHSVMNADLAAHIALVNAFFNPQSQVGAGAVTTDVPSTHFDETRLLEFFNTRIERANNEETLANLLKFYQTESSREGSILARTAPATVIAIKNTMIAKIKALTIAQLDREGFSGNASYTIRQYLENFARKTRSLGLIMNLPGTTAATTHTEILNHILNIAKQKSPEIKALLEANSASQFATAVTNLRVQLGNPDSTIAKWLAIPEIFHGLRDALNAQSETLKERLSVSDAPIYEQAVNQLTFVLSLVKALDLDKPINIAAIEALITPKLSSLSKDDKQELLTYYLSRCIDSNTSIYRAINEEFHNAAAIAAHVRIVNAFFGPADAELDTRIISFFTDCINKTNPPITEKALSELLKFYNLLSKQEGSVFTHLKETTSSKIKEILIHKASSLILAQIDQEASKNSPADFLTRTMFYYMNDSGRKHTVRGSIMTQPEAAEAQASIIDHLMQKAAEIVPEIKAITEANNSEELLKAVNALNAQLQQSEPSSGINWTFSKFPALLDHLQALIDSKASALVVDLTAVKLQRPAPDAPASRAATLPSTAASSGGLGGILRSVYATLSAPFMRRQPLEVATASSHTIPASVIHNPAITRELSSTTPGMRGAGAGAGVSIPVKKEPPVADEKIRRAAQHPLPIPTIEVKVTNLLENLSSLSSSFDSERSGNILKSVDELKKAWTEQIAAIKSKYEGQDLTNLAIRAAYMEQITACCKEAVEHINTLITPIDGDASSSSDNDEAYFLKFILKAQMQFAFGSAKQISDFLITEMQTHPQYAERISGYYLDEHKKSSSNLSTIMNIKIDFTTTAHNAVMQALSKLSTPVVVVAPPRPEPVAAAPNGFSLVGAIAYVVSCITWAFGCTTQRQQPVAAEGTVTTGSKPAVSPTIFAEQAAQRTSTTTTPPVTRGGRT